MLKKEIILIKDLGMKFPTEKSKRKRRFGLYKCYCGKEFEAETANVNFGTTTSCGCFNKLRSSKHNLCNHRLYHTWVSMKNRCLNVNDTAYKYYGGLGITVCKEWLDIKNFIEDMYPSYQEGLTLDRIDPNGDYEPSNCRWATMLTQSINKKVIMSTNTSGYRGVSWNKKNKKWYARISVGTKRIHLGSFDNKNEAAKKYNEYIDINNLDNTKNIIK